MKFRSYCCVAVASLLVSCGGGGSSGNDKPASTVYESIAGNWTFLVPGTTCEESYDFNTDGTFVIRSLAEVVSGSYEFEEEIPEGGRHFLRVTISQDNGQPDCLGDSTNDTGGVLSAYIEFPDSATSDWYDDVSGGDAFAVMQLEPSQ